MNRHESQRGVCPHGSAEFTSLERANISGRFPKMKEFSEGRFGRLFSTKHPLFKVGARAKRPLEKLAASMSEGSSTSKSGDSTIPAGFTFLGQFIDHDVTLDPISKLEEDNSDVGAFRNFRTPNLDLDCVYGSGPDASPHLYYPDVPGKIILGRNTRGGDDLQRNRFGRALIGDPRNDENLFVSHIQLAFIKFHNAILELSGGDFEKAQETVIWCYHQLIIDDFLPRIVGKKIVHQLKKSGPLFFVDPGPKRSNFPYLPIEFSVAAYRYGHSQVRSNYHVNSEELNRDVFDLGGFQQARDSVDMRYLFEIPGSPGLALKSRKIDTKLPATLFQMPPRVGGDEPSLPSRNLRRGASFALPSGQSVARMVRAKVPGTPVLKPDAATKRAGLTETPLWYYLLQEARSAGGGNQLGPVGGRIVGEVLWGLMGRHPKSATRKAMARKVRKHHKGAFTMAKLLRIAGMV